MRSAGIIVVALAALLLLSNPTIVSVKASPSTLYVNDDAQTTGDNTGCTNPLSNTIAAAIASANPGDTIHICSGTYDEHPSLTKSGITISGDGIEQTIIRPAAATTFASPYSGRPFAAMFLVRGASNVVIEDLTVDGSLLTLNTCPPFEFGILYFESSGTVRSVQATNIWQPQLGPFSCGVGIALISRPANSLLVDGNTLDHYNIGIRCTSRGATCVVTNNILHGEGPIDYTLQGGIFVTDGAVADIRSNTITGHFYTPKGDIFDAISVGIALFYVDPDTNPHLLERNTFDGNELNVQRYATANAL